jgi:hypothetical protein
MVLENKKDRVIGKLKNGWSDSQTMNRLVELFFRKSEAHLN